MYRSNFTTAVRILPFALLALGACTSESPAAPELSPSLSRLGAPDVHVARAMICPSSESFRTDGVIGPRGGSLHVAGHRLTIPAGVLSRRTHLTLRAPAGREVRLDLSAAGAEHYEFSSPVVVTISYDRCRRQHQPPAPLSVWHVDDSGNRLIELMGGQDDRTRRRVTFRTTHFSTYLVAY